MDVVLTAILGVVVLYVLSGLRVFKEYERGVLFVLGRSWGAKGPGLRFLPPLLTKIQTVSLRVVAMDVPPQDVITRDNISIKVNAVLYMRVADPVKAVIGVENFLYATSQLAQTTLRSVLGETELDELLMNREKINNILKNIIDKRAEDWGIEVSAVEVKDVDLPPEMRSEEHTSELQSRLHLVCRLLLEKKKSNVQSIAGFRHTHVRPPAQGRREPEPPRESAALTTECSGKSGAALRVERPTTRRARAIN